MTDEQAQKLGELVRELLSLKQFSRYEEKRVDTSHGTKTDIGLGRTILALVSECGA
jgi:hypothetical protein